MQTQRTWMRMVGEGAMVVGSILLAFSIDAAWDRRQDRAEEQHILSGLRAEFTEAQQRLARTIARNDSIQDAITMLLNGVKEDGSSLDEREAETALMLLLVVPTLDLPGGTREALVRGGRLDLLENTELRDLVAGWEGRLDEVLDNQLTMRVFVVEVLVPRLAQRGVELQRVLATRPHGGPWPDPVPADGASRKVTELSHDEEFRSLAAYRIWWLSASKGETEGALETAGRILQLIEAGLAA